MTAPERPRPTPHNSLLANGIRMRLLIIFYYLSIFIGTAAIRAETRPNVLFLAVDDMNDWIGCLESIPHAKTPNIDRLAARGVNFTNAHTAGVFCAPSRAAIFSGQYAFTTGCYRTPNYFVHHPDIVPLQASFAEAGYRTFGTGKLFHHTAGAIDVRGWDQFFLRREIQRKNGWPLETWSDDSPFPTPFPNSIFNKGERVTGGLFLEWAAISNDREEEMADTIRIDWALKKLSEKHDKPFFLGVGIYAPHFPNYCPQKYFDLYDVNLIDLPKYKENDLDDLPSKIRKEKVARSRIHKKLQAFDSVADAIHGYLACISYADAMMGRVLDALAASPYADNTVVVLWSDHGYHHGEKGDWGKHTLWERTSNVPYIWAGPGIAQGQQTSATVSLIDMYPTFVDLCELPQPPQNLDGYSLKKTLRNPTAAPDRNVLLPYLEPGEFAVINENWRYIHYGTDGDELYDVQADPHEWDNLAPDPKYAEQIARMRQFAPTTFAGHEPKLNLARDLLLDGHSFRWDKGHGNATPRRAYLPKQNTPHYALGDNLISNPSFEENVLSGSDWSYRDRAFEVSTQRQKDGKCSLASGKSLKGERSARQSIKIKMNQFYEVSYQIFFNPGSEGNVVFDTFDRFDETAQIVMDASLGGGWRGFRCRFNSHQYSDVTLRFFPTESFSGRFFIDDVRLSEITD